MDNPAKASTDVNERNPSRDDTCNKFEDRSVRKSVTINHNEAKSFEEKDLGKAENNLAEVQGSASYRKLPPPEASKPSTSGYYISKVGNEIKSLPPAPNRNIGKVFLLPRQIVSRSTNAMNDNSLECQLGNPAPLNTDAIHGVSGQMPTLPQTVNRFILRPFPSYTSTDQSNTMNKQLSNVCESVQITEQNSKKRGSEILKFTEYMPAVTSPAKYSGSHSLYTTEKNSSPPNSRHKTTRINCKQAKSLPNIIENRSTTTTGPSYYRDIRPSVSGLISEITDVSCKELSSSDKTDNPGSLSGMQQNQTQELHKSNSSSSVEMKPVTESNDKSSKSTELDKVDSTKTIDHREIKTPTKGTRNRKPKVNFSPSGNAISEENCDTNTTRVYKVSRKRKTVEKTVDQQYFGALHRTFSKKAKTLNNAQNVTDHDVQEETDPKDAKSTMNRMLYNEQNSDYEHKALLNVSSATLSEDKLNGHHLLKKLDPNDPDRKSSLVVFTRQHQLQESDTVASYKISISSSLASAQKRKTEALKKSSGIDDEKQVLNHRKDGTLLNLQDDLIQVNKESTESNEPRDTARGHKPDKNESENNINTSKENTLKASKSDYFPVAKLGPSALPTVVLQRITGITPTKTVQVSQLLKQPSTAVVAERIQNTEELEMNEGNKAENKVEVNRNVNSSTSERQTDNENSSNGVVRHEESTLDKMHEKIANKQETGDVPPKVKDITTDIMHGACTINDMHATTHETKVSTQISLESIVTSNKLSDKKTDTMLNPRKCVSSNTKQIAETVGESKTNPNNTALPSTVNYTEALMFAQPIPVFYHTGGRLVKGSIPVSSNKFILNKGQDAYVKQSSSNDDNYIDTHLADKGVSKTQSCLKTLCSTKAPVLNFKTISTTISVNDPTGILAPVPNDTGAVDRFSTNHKGKTVADLLKEKRGEQNKKDANQSSLEFISPVSTFLRRENNLPNKDDILEKASEPMKEHTQRNNSTEKEQERIGSEASLFVRKDGTIVSFPGPVKSTSVRKDGASESLPGTVCRPVSDHLYSTSSIKQLLQKPPLRSSSYSPLAAIADIEHKYSRSLSQSDVRKRLSTESIEPKDVTENSQKGSPITPRVPLKIVLPSPQSSKEITNTAPTKTNPVMIQTIPIISKLSDNAFSSKTIIKPTEMSNVDTMHQDGLQTQNQTFAVRIGDKMYIIRPAFPIDQTKINATDTKSLEETTKSPKPATVSFLKPSKTPKSSKKRKSPASKEKQCKPRQSATHQKDMKKKLKKFLKKDKTPFEELIQSLGLEHSKEKRKKLKRKPVHKIVYSSTPSPAHSTHNINGSPLPIKEEPVTPDVDNIYGTNTKSTTPGNSGSKPRLKSKRTLEKKATVLQIFKTATKGSRFYVHTVKINFITGGNSNYHRWYNHSDYPCTLHMRNSDTLYQIDTESLRSGFYLVSEMEKNVLKSKTPDNITVTAVLSLYPPDLNILPDESLSVAVGKIDDFDESEQPIPNEIENDCVNKTADSIIRNILKIDTFKDVGYIEDERYGSVKDVTMSPKFQSSKFYSPELFDCFTYNKRRDVKRISVKPCNADNTAVSEKSCLEVKSESEKTVSAKAHELKMKQTELYEECSKLKDKIQTGKGLLLANDLAPTLESVGELDVVALPEEEEDFDPASTDSQSLMECKSIETARYEARGGKSTAEINYKKFEAKSISKESEEGCDNLAANKNVNCSVSRRRRRGKFGLSQQVENESARDIRRCTRSFSVKE